MELERLQAAPLKLFAYCIYQIGNHIPPSGTPLFACVHHFSPKLIFSAAFMIYDPKSEENVHFSRIMMKASTAFQPKKV